MRKTRWGKTTDLRERDNSDTADNKKREEPGVLTRAEYTRLLHAAKSAGDSAGYFSVKIFGDTGIRSRDLPLVTAEAVRTGRVETPDEVIVLPRCLQEELRDYLEREGRRSGPVLAQKNGQPLNRGTVCRLLANTARRARIPREKVTPKSLRDLCRRTYDQISASFAAVTRRTYEQLLETEQGSIGWAV